MNPNFDPIQVLESALQQTSYRDEEDLVAVTIGLSASVYLESGHSLPVRQAVADCFDEYLSLAGQHLRWAMPGKQGPVPLDGRALDFDPRRFLREPERDENQSWEFNWHGGQKAEDASPYQIRALGVRRWQAELRGDLSYLGSPSISL